MTKLQNTEAKPERTKGEIYKFAIIIERASTPL